MDWRDAFWLKSEYTDGRLAAMRERPASTMDQYMRVVRPMLTSVFLASPALTIWMLKTMRTIAAQKDLGLWVSDQGLMLRVEY